MKKLLIPGGIRSPMLSRVRRTTGAPRFTAPFRLPFAVPRKGRIRFALGVLALILLVKLLAGMAGHSPSAAGPAPGHTARAADYDLRTLTELLKHTPPGLESSCDTLRFDGRTLAVSYSVDTVLQRAGASLLKQYHPKYGAIAMLEASTGRALCLVSYTNEGEPSLGGNLFCRSIFPAASIFKTVTASGAIERGSYVGESMVRLAGGNHTLYNYQLAQELRQSREMSLAEAYARSVNPVFGRLGIFLLGKSGVRSYADKYGFGQPVPFELPTDASHVTVPDSAYELAEVASGFNEETTISPLFGALMAGAICGNGRCPEPTLVDSIVDVSSGRRLYRAQPAVWRTPIRTGTACELRDMMEDVTSYGTARKSFRHVRNSSLFREIQYGGKTGTIDKDSLGRVDWFIGFARHPFDTKRQVAVGIVTVHGPYWTIHSSYIGAELFRRHLQKLDKKQDQPQRMEAVQSADDSAHTGG